MSKLDKNGLAIRVCLDCKKNSNDTDFHMSKSGKPQYYSKRCIVCQNLYRLKLKQKDVDTATCIDCGKTNDEVLFGVYKLPNKKVFFSRCNECISILENTSNYIPERFCWRCEESSNDKQFRSKLYSSVGKQYYVNYCNECEKIVEYQKFLIKHKLSEIICKFCGESSQNKYFSHYKLRDKVILYDFCFDCTDKNTTPEPKLCNKCGKKSNETEFSTRRTIKNGYETIYHNICQQCMTKQRKKEYNTVDKKLKAFKKSAIDRDYEWKLTDEEAIRLFEDNCYYCGKESIKGEDMNGIDRVDNLIGYTSENSVSCCGICNNIKGKIDQKTFIKKCIEIAKLHSEEVSNSDHEDSD